MLLCRYRRGFTLVEIMIVVAIIGLLSAFAITYLICARLNANEGAVKSDLRAISVAAESFYSAQAVPTYPATLDVLSAAGPPYLDNTFVNGVVKHGHILNLEGDANGFGATGVPQTAGVTGTGSYCVDRTGVVRVQAAGGAYAAVATGCGVVNPPIGA